MYKDPRQDLGQCNFYCKIAYSSLEEVINFKVILFSNTMTVQFGNMLQNNPLFLSTWQFSRPPCKCRVAQKLRN